MPTKNLKINLAIGEDESNITVYYRGQTHIAHSSHPAWEQIVQKAVADDPSVIELFDLSVAIGNRLALSSRISYAKGQILVDNDVMDDALTQHIIRMVQEQADVAPFVALLENILQNPSERSRKMLYGFIQANRITITHDGMLVFYKGVFRRDDHRGSGSKYPGHPQEHDYLSSSSGPAIINGQPHKSGQVPQKVGDVIEVPRSQVKDDGSACSAGSLHVGNWHYAQGFGSPGWALEVHVHPRDVGNVPSGYGDQDKVRVCRYKVIGERTEPYKEAVLPAALVQRIEIPEQEYEGNRYLASDKPQSPPAKIKHPSRTELLTMQGRAKSRRQNFVKYAQKVGKWTLLEGDGSKRSHWSVNS